MTGQLSQGPNTRKVATWCGRGKIHGSTHTARTGADAPPLHSGAPAPTYALGAASVRGSLSPSSCPPVGELA